MCRYNATPLIKFTVSGKKRAERRLKNRRRDGVFISKNTLRVHNLTVCLSIGHRIVQDGYSLTHTLVSYTVQSLVDRRPTREGRALLTSHRLWGEPV